MVEMDELIDGLRITESKLVYQKEILSRAVQKALEENDMKLSAKFFVSSLIVDSIIEVLNYFLKLYFTKSILDIMISLIIEKCCTYSEVLILG